ncbi:MAG: acyltransferase [Nitrospirales bacterium]|nr:MAG: acyltransferase [Nitrospirales bacterium]
MTTFLATGYKPQLDSLRALAAFGVFMQHFLDEENLFRTTIPIGDLGVRLFFVLSGFLITGLLLDGRDQVETFRRPTPTLFIHFYVRRFLRLTPIYYLALLLILVFTATNTSQLWWFFAYLQNIHFTLNNEFTIADHFWTLAVEEQFYLFWPFVILFVPRTYIFSVVLVAVIIGPLFRLLCLSIGLTHFQGSMLMPAHLDTLGIGALLAILSRKVEIDKFQLQRILIISCSIGFLLLSSVLISKIIDAPSSIEFVLGELGAGLLFAWIIGKAAEGFAGPIGLVLNRPTLIYFGRISYGMYVIHLFVPDLLNGIGLMSLLPHSFNHDEWIRLFLFSGVSILLAMVSRHLLEKPINNLKRYFPM